MKEFLDKFCFYVHHLRTWVWVVLVVLLAWIVFASVRGCKSAHTAQSTTQDEREAQDDDQRGSDKEQKAKTKTLVFYPGKNIKCADKFRDRQDKHLSAAKKIGLTKGPKDRDEAAKMSGKLKKVSTNEIYVVEDLTYSVPYLVPKAAARLNAIGEEFQDILSRNNLPPYRFRVTSVLRTNDDIKRLQRSGNGNAVSNSAHNYGTTFDLAYTKFVEPEGQDTYMTDDNLKLVLAQTLLNQQRAGKIYVKYEYKQCCFHITVRE